MKKNKSIKLVFPIILFSLLIIAGKTALASEITGTLNTGGSSGGGGSIVTYCLNVAYGEWGVCVNGIKQRAVSTSTPTGCGLTAAQRLEQSKLCIMPRILPEILSVKYYTNGQLIRGQDKKIYLIDQGKLAVIRNLAQLRKYAGQKIYDVTDAVIGQYPHFPDGSIIRGSTKKIYVITNGKKQLIFTFAELRKYTGRKIYDVSDEILGLY